MIVTLVNRWFTTHFFKACLLLLAVECGLSAPLTSRLIAADTTDLAAEYEEWGLEPPVDKKGPEVDSKPLAPQPQDSAEKADAAVGPAVPSDLEEQFSQAAVLIVAIMEDGKELHASGWIVDKERQVVMTNHPLVAHAIKLFVGYPQLPGAEKGSMTGSPALLMQSNGHPGITYLLVESTIPATLTTLTLAGSREQPTDSGQGGFSRAQASLEENSWPSNASLPNPLVGQWYLQDDVGDYELTMMVMFGARGEFRMETIAVDYYGSEDREVLVGTYSVRGNTLYLQTNDGPQQAQFKLEGGYLTVTIPDGVVTFTFERV